jgi:hypothetical protein
METSFNNFYLKKKLPGTTKGQDIFDAVDSDFSFHDVSCKSCISICTDGAPYVSGSLKGFVALAKQKNPRIIVTHFFLYREAHISK